MAGAKEYKGCAEVFGIDKLLQTVCQRFCKDSKVSRSLMVDFVFIFSFHFIISFFSFFFYFLFLEQTWVRVYQSRCHISHKLMV